MTNNHSSKLHILYYIGRVHDTRHPNRCYSSFLNSTQSSLINNAVSCFDFYICVYLGVETITDISGKYYVRRFSKCSWWRSLDCSVCSLIEANFMTLNVRLSSARCPIIINHFLLRFHDDDGRGAEHRGDWDFSDSFGGFALIVNGYSLVHALGEDLELLFLEVACRWAFTRRS